ncbi:uncharacterized protein FFUJ_01689 [Fusarium fujikuroi IMI 58289]|uniref:Uncharacterized protein n=1 Tax=Gibberella fujikuroi (strain CBS 195.34 / IMI 58289 / NRRL A-6831) TaxID=1279085 RepID=S0DI60_GIBF5|nr:uncharacterized protein FFUJ_01689 [Fusarium fujikuroi IMI 58289]CCT61820.1 uncharacterized protein FFUJ_01689 [Fusarium fujikuroi IMI 58289]
MENTDSDKPRPVAPPEPISPALSSGAPKPSTSRAASPARVPTPDSARAIKVKSPLVESAPLNVATTAISATTAPRAASPPAAMPPSPLPRASTPAPVTKDRAPSPVNAHSPSTANGKSPVVAPQINGRKISIGDVDAESELSEPASTLHSPSGVDFNELEDEIVVGARTNGIRKSSPLRPASEGEDEIMGDAEDEPVASHYPKRKRNSIFQGLNERKMEPVRSLADERQSQATATKGKPPRLSTGSVKGVTIGYWRDSEAPTVDLKHAVIGFIDVRERLRTRIQPTTLSGETISDEYPLPPGPGGSWVTFDKIVFLDHLVGLDQLQVKEYVKIRAEAIGTDELEGEKAAAEKAAAKEAVRRANLNSTAEHGTNLPQVAYGVDLPEHLQQNRDAKRRRTSGGFAPANPPPSNGPVIEHTPIQPAPGGPQPLRHTVDPLPGSRPTRILIGHWAKSNSPDPRDRHAVYGILGQNDMFRVKLVRETRDGRFVEGNFPAGAGALWIAYEEVAFEPHLKNLARNEIKEYCRVRQYQIDMGEKEGERTSNETKAVYEAQARAAGTNYKAPAPLSRRMGYGGHELRQSRRVEAARAEARQSYIDIDTTPPQPAAAPRQSTGRTSLNNNAIERTSALAEREIARVELAQERAHMQAANRERAAAAAAQAAQAAAANIPGLAVNGRQQLHERDEMQRLNKVWARQESLRLRTNAEDAKMYAGVKYERKTQGPFTGKLVSQGTIINIDGEDYIEYRVLAKPSFF